VAPATDDPHDPLGTTFANLDAARLVLVGVGADPELSVGVVAPREHGAARREPERKLGAARHSGKLDGVRDPEPRARDLDEPRERKVVAHAVPELTFGAAAPRKQVAVTGQCRAVLVARSDGDDRRRLRVAARMLQLRRGHHLGREGRDPRGHRGVALAPKLVPRVKAPRRNAPGAQRHDMVRAAAHRGPRVAKVLQRRADFIRRQVLGQVQGRNCTTQYAQSIPKGGGCSVLGGFFVGFLLVFWFGT
jgi:hypothetical protein